MSVLDLHWYIYIYINTAFGKTVILETDLLLMTTLMHEKIKRFTPCFIVICLFVDADQFKKKKYVYTHAFHFISAS